MATQMEWIKRVEQWKRSGLEAAEFAQREGLQLEELSGWCKELGTSPPPAAAPTAPPAPAWIKIALPNRSLVYVLPGVDPATLACVVAVAAELSVKGVVAARSEPATQVALRHGRR